MHSALIIYKLVLIFNSRYIVQHSLLHSLLSSIHALPIIPKCHLASRDLPCQYMYSSLRTAWSRGMRLTGSCFTLRQYIAFQWAKSEERVCGKRCTQRGRHAVRSMNAWPVSNCVWPYCTISTLSSWGVTCYGTSSAIKIFTYGCDMLWSSSCHTSSLL